MGDPLILRGLIQFVALASFYIGRYMLDVLFTPSVLDALLRDAGRCAMSTAKVAWPLVRSYYAPLLPLVAIRAWQCCTAELVGKWLLSVCSLRLVMHIVMDDGLRIGNSTKGDVWPAIVPLAQFVHVSGGRATSRAGLRRWFCGHRHALCIAVPWAVRAALLVALAALLQGRWERPAPVRPGPSTRDCNCPGAERCTTFTGQPLPCDELRLAREFNSNVMPSMQRASYREIRRAMTDFGLYGSGWHVGHACPDPDKDSTGNEEDQGWNLFAQHATDNFRLGHCLVSCLETAYMAASHAPCSTSEKCATSCSERDGR